MILTNTLINDILLGDEKEADFLLSKNKAQSRVRKLLFSSHPRNVPFLLEIIMDKIQCKTCKRIFLNYLSNHRKYCSMKCRNKGWSIIMKNNHPKYWLGKHRSEKTKEKIRKNGNFNAKGKLHPAWKGGTSPLRVIIWHSEKYKKWRRAVFIRDNYTCQECNQKGGGLEAHHIKEFAKYPKLRFVVNNGLTLCEICHINKRRKNGLPNGHESRKR